MDSQIRELGRDQWVAFFDETSRRHTGAGSMATLEVSGLDIGNQIAANALPFGGISADLKDKEDQITILLGGEQGTTDGVVRDHDAHIIDAPRHVFLHGDAGTSTKETLEIMTSDDVQYLLRFDS